MANRTVKDAHSIKGTNPQYLIEKIIRSRIYDSQYWKEECFALSGNFNPLKSRRILHEINTSLVKKIVGLGQISLFLLKCFSRF